MYGIEFYETEDGKCPIWDFLEALRLKAPTNKDARIQHKQASLYIELLHQFRKKSQKTPKREIEIAKTERNDYLRRKETAKL